MNRLILATALTVTLGLPSIALAADSMAPATSSSLVCHTAKAGETANAAMGDTKLTCTAVNMTKVHEAMDTMHTVMMKATPDQAKQMTSAMTALSSAFLMPFIAGGTENANK